MLVGTADPESLADGAPTLSGFDTAPLRFDGVETLQVFCEMKRDGAESLLPPGLHPTLPPVVTWLVQRVPESPWGSFGMVPAADPSSRGADRRLLTRVLGLTGSSSRMMRCNSPTCAERRRWGSKGVVPVSSS